VDTTSNRREVVASVAAQKRSVGSGLKLVSVPGNTEWSGPFLSVDQFVMTEPTFGIHPHAGFSAVTVMMEDSEGTFRNRDSLGTDVLIPPGSVHWTVAGSGIFHEEVPTQAPTPCYGLQIFVALPDEFELAGPMALHLEPDDVPVVEADGARVRVLVGTHDGRSSPLAPPGSPSGVFLYDVTVQADAEVSLAPPDHTQAFVIAISGSGQVNGNPISADHAVGLGLRGEVALRGGPAGLHVIVAGGAPLGREQVWAGGISTGSAARTAQLNERLRSGAFQPF
jgi:redox-sensitive bicupin YhaK (pirin superfamily)